MKNESVQEFEIDFGETGPDKISVNYIEYDSDCWYDVIFSFRTEDYYVKSKLYINEDDLIELKNNINEMYNFNKERFEMHFEQIGISDDLILRFVWAKDVSCVRITAILKAGTFDFNASLITDLESIKTFSNQIRIKKANY